MTISEPIRYRLVGWGYRSDVMAHTLFQIQLNTDYAKKALAAKDKNIDIDHFQRRMTEICREGIDKETRLTFFENSILLRTFAVSGNCCCMGIDGSEQEPKHWGETIGYHGHNNDTIDQAYRLLWVFTTWLEFAEAFLEEE